jgi:death-on-curing protein
VTEFLTLDDLVQLASDIGAGPVRDIGLLSSAGGRPQTTLMGRDAYPDLATKAAALLHSIVCNHALVDGNKRLGWFAAVVFLRINGYDAELAHDEAFDLIMAVASGELRDVDAIAARLAVRDRE